jgi:FG-GAP-like repeat/FG-GAP repeat
MMRNALLLMLAVSCSRPRTEIILRINTDMVQGAGQELPAIRLRVTGEHSAVPEYDKVIALGAGTWLPASLGLLPSGARDALVSVEIDALDGNSSVQFTKRAAAHYVPGRALLLDVFLARRCVAPSHQVCPSGESCGQSGCEADLRTGLPDFTNQPPGDDGGLPPDDLSVPGDLSMEPDLSVSEDLSTVDSALPDISMPADFSGADQAMPIDMSIVHDLSVLHDFSINVDLEPPPADLGPTGIPAPRPIEPASSAFTTSTTVRFRWALTAPADGARLEICGDRACTDIRQTNDVTGSSTTAVITPAPGSSRIFYFRLTGLQGAMAGSAHSPVWSFGVQGLAPSVTGTWGTIEDLDGDGFSDILGGAPASSKVRLYRGRTPAGGTPALDVEFSAPALAKLGDAVFGAGDLDGDGFADLAIGSETTLYFFHGRTPLPATLTNTGADSSIPLPSPASRATVAAGGDINGDGYADVVVGDPGAGRILVYFGGFFGIQGAGTPFVRGDAGFGTSVAGACDVNADGFADVIVGGSGNATVLLGGSGGLGSPISLTPGPSASPGPTAFGASVSCAGDVNADGYGDVIVGAPLDHAAFIYHGGVSGTSSTLNGALRKIPGDPGGGMTKQGDHFGTEVSAAGDLNADGYGDVVVAAPDPAGFEGTFMGYVFTFHGRPGGLPTTAVGGNTTHQRALGASSSLNRRQVSQWAGDVNGDGIGDLVTGAPPRNSGGGSVEMNLGIAYTPGAPNENLTGGPVVAPTWDIAPGALVGLGTTIARVIFPSKFSAN